MISLGTSDSIQPNIWNIILYMYKYRVDQKSQHSGLFLISVLEFQFFFQDTQVSLAPGATPVRPSVGL